MHREHPQLQVYTRLLARMDMTFVALVICLLLTGVLFIYGVGQKAGGRFTDYWRLQLFWTGLGLIFFVVLSCVDYELLGRFSWVLYALSTVLLVLVWLFGWTANDARSWLELPLIGKRIQPAELAKPITVLLLAWVVSRPRRRVRWWTSLFAFGALLMLPVTLVALQPDWGTALVFLPAGLAIVFAAGLPWRWVLAGICAVVLMAPILYPRLTDKHKDRIKTFVEAPANLALVFADPLLPAAPMAELRRRVTAGLEPSRSQADTRYNAHQSLLAVGSGGLWGKGFQGGTQHVLGFLPRTVAPTDFIFSVIAEEAGFVGAGALVCAFIGIILCCLRTAALAPDAFGAYLAVGIGMLFFVHAYINIGMTIQAAPIIGIPLPFVSYGGSFMVSTLIGAGLVQSVHVRRREP